MTISHLRGSKPIFALSAAALLFVSACTDPSRFDPSEPDRNQTQAGAIVGGITGVIAGIAASSREDRVKGALIGGVVGAGTGAAIGQRLDQQEEDLRASMGNQNVDIVNTGSELMVTMPQDILFPIDGASLRPDLQRDLASLAANLQAYPDTTVQILGHTDNTGSAGYNQGLSQRRAEAVAQVLINNGVGPNRLRSIGRGETAPVADNLTAQGRAQNRRVEVVITPNA